MGLIDTGSELHGSSLQGVAVFGGDDRLQDLKREGVSHFFVGVGGAADNTPRKRLFELGLRQGMAPVDVVHRQAVVSIHARLGKGIASMSGAVVEHDCVIGDHVHLATRSCLAGSVVVGDCAHIGLNASIKQEISIGQHAIVGAGAVVVKDVIPYAVVSGVPAQVMGR